MTTHKAWIAAVVAFLGSLLATLQGRTDLDTMHVVDWLVVLLTALVAGAATWGVPNRVRHQRAARSEPPPPRPF